MSVLIGKKKEMKLQQQFISGSGFTYYSSSAGRHIVQIKQETLCDRCKNIHLVSKLSKHHTVFNIENILDGGIDANDNVKCLSTICLPAEEL